MTTSRDSWQRLWFFGTATASAALLVFALKAARKHCSSQPKEEDDEGSVKTDNVPSPADTLRLLKSRRSIFPKDYNGKGKNPNKKDLELLLEAANWAPTHKRNEPWRFVVFQGQSSIAQVCEATIEGNRAASDDERGGESFETWYNDFQLNGIEKKWSRCNTLIALCMLREAQLGKRLPEWEEIAAVSCAVQNMHIMATSLGLSCYWSSWNIAGRDSAPMSKLLGISLPNGDRCLGFFVIGSSDKVGKVRSGRGPISAKTRWVGADDHALAGA